MLNLMLFIGLRMLFCPLQRGLGAPGREPVVTEDEQKKMMAYYYKKQEEFKVCKVLILRGYLFLRFRRF